MSVVYDDGSEEKRVVFTQPGMRYSITKGIAKLLPQDRNYRMRYDFHEEGTAYFADSFDNVSMLTGVPSVNSFISTVEGGLFTFYDLIGSPRNVTTTGSFSEPEMALLSARFYLTSNRDGDFYCVDISEFAVNKLTDRGSLSSRGIITNVQDFIVTLSKGLGL